MNRDKRIWLRCPDNRAWVRCPDNRVWVRCPDNRVWVRHLDNRVWVSRPDSTTWVRCPDKAWVRYPYLSKEQGRGVGGAGKYRHAIVYPGNTGPWHFNNTSIEGGGGGGENFRRVKKMDPVG